LQTIDNGKLEWACTKADDLMMPVWQRLRHGLAWIMFVPWAELKVQDESQWFAW